MCDFYEVLNHPYVNSSAPAAQRVRQTDRQADWYAEDCGIAAVGSQGFALPERALDYGKPARDFRSADERSQLHDGTAGVHGWARVDGLRLVVEQNDFIL